MQADFFLWQKQYSRINRLQVENTFRSLRNEVRKTERELLKLTPGTEAFMKKAQEVKVARKHFADVKSEIDAVRRSTEKADGWFKRLGKTIGTSVLNAAKGFTLANFSKGEIAKAARSVNFWVIID